MLSQYILAIMAAKWPSMVNPPLMGYNTKNRATLQELPEKSLIPGKRKRKLLLEIEKKEGKKLKSFQRPIK